MPLSEMNERKYKEYVLRLREEIENDVIVCNTDRHFGNFGFLVDNRTIQIVAPAPLFDHGNALFNCCELQTESGINVTREQTQKTKSRSRLIRDDHPL